MLKKKNIKILSVNIIIILLLVFVSEIISFKLLNKVDPNFHYIFKSEKFDQIYSSDYINDPVLWFRPVEKGRKGKTILLFGCCMTHGIHQINSKVDNPARKGWLSFVLNQYTDMTVINRGISGWGLQHMYYQLSHPNFISDIKEKPDYVVYTIIRDHYRRLFSNSSANEPNYLLYARKGNELIRKKDSFLNRSLIVYLAKQLYCQNNFDTELVNFYILKSYEKMKEINPDIKFIILDMDGIPELYQDDFLQGQGIKIIDLTKYTDGLSIHDDNMQQYWGDDSRHPSSKYWHHIIPKIVDNFQ